MSPGIAFLPDRLYRMWNGLFLTRDDFTASYAIIRHNIRTFQSAGVLAVVTGKQRAESELKKLKIPKTPQIGMRGGATLKEANRKPFGRQRLGSSLREILRD